MRVPHVNVLKVLAVAGQPLTLIQLTAKAGYNVRSGTASHALYGVSKGRDHTLPQTGLLKLGYVQGEPMQGAFGGRAVNHFSITAIGKEALEEGLAATGGKLPVVRTALTAGSLASNVRFQIESGWPSSLDTFLRRISAYTRSDRVRRWKIGISAYPKRRAGQHNRSDIRYDEMVVIYMTRSIKNARLVEQWITMEYVGHHDNKRHGGGGLKAAADAHYVYLLLRR
jgi:hypothetical protein